MSITYITGIPRSGKSYYSTYLLYRDFVYSPKDDTVTTRLLSKFFKPKEKLDYEYVYININQFDLDKHEKFKKFDFDVLKQKLQILQVMYLNKVTDDELNAKAKELKVYKSLYVIDESHNFFTSKADDLLVWFLTYHGHLYIDIYFITQDLEHTSSQYKKIAEFFYKAIPPANRLSAKKFRYVQYSSYKMHQNKIIGDFTVPSIKEVFNMYVSGAKNDSKPIIHKIMKYVLFGLLLLMVLFYFFFRNFSSSDKLSDNNSSISSMPFSSSKNIKDTNNTSNDNSSFFDDEQLILFNVTCTKITCKYNDKSFPFVYFEYLSNKYNLEFILMQKSKDFVKFWFEADYDFKNKLRSTIHEEDNNKPNSFKLFGSSK